jgi:hypothetical protein
MDSLILSFETIRDNVSNDSLKIPHICCSLNDFMDVSVNLCFETISFHTIPWSLNVYFVDRVYPPISIEYVEINKLNIGST